MKNVSRLLKGVFLFERKSVFGISVGIFFAMAVSGSAYAIQEKVDVIEKTRKKDSKKSTDVSFDDVLVDGRFNFSDEPVVTVEDDKVLDALLAVPKDFQDRIAKSAEQK